MSLCKADQEIVANLYKSGAATQVVMSTLQEKYESCPVTARDLYNFGARIVHKKLKEQSPIQTLLDEVDETTQSHKPTDFGAYFDKFLSEWDAEEELIERVNMTQD